MKQRSHLYTSLAILCLLLTFGCRMSEGLSDYVHCVGRYDEALEFSGWWGWQETHHPCCNSKPRGYKAAKDCFIGPEGETTEIVGYPFQVRDQDQLNADLAVVVQMQKDIKELKEDLDELRDRIVKLEEAK